MVSKEIQINILKSKVNKAEAKGNGTAGVVRKWNRQIRNLQK
jgi:hypothetical protein